MNTIFKIVLFGICINIATGLMMFMIPAFNTLQYNPNMVHAGDDFGFNSQMNGTINPTPDQSNTFFRLMDSIGLGLITKLLKALDTGLYGFLNFIALIFQLPTGIVLTFKGLLGICYILGAFWLWTGKDVTQ